MLDLAGINRILIVKPSSLGDIVHSLPFLNALKAHFKNAEVHWIVARGLDGLLEGHPLVDRLWVIEKDRWKKPSLAVENIREITSLIKALRRQQFGLVVDLQGLLRSGIITAATGAGLRVGFREAREGSALFYTHRVTGGKDVHAVERYMKVAAYLGCDTGDISFPMVTEPYPLPFEEYAVLVPGAKWKTKQWPPDRFGELASKLALNSVVIGGRADAGLAEEVVSRSGGRAVTVAGKTSLRELAGIIKAARFMVSNDTGPMHMAAALNVPVFALFGPTNPVRTGPWGGMHTIVSADPDCSPCYRRRCRDPLCMHGIQVERVLNIIDDWRSSRKP